MPKLKVLLPIFRDTTISLNCHHIKLMDEIPGKIELTSSHISFYDDSNDSLVRCDFQFSLEKLREMHMRRYKLQETGLEFFLDDGSSYLINFGDCKVYASLLRLCTLNFEFFQVILNRESSMNSASLETSKSLGAFPILKTFFMSIYLPQSYA